MASTKKGIVSPRSHTGRGGLDFSRPAGRVLLMAGLVFLLTTLADLVTLWVFQRQEAVQWEFVAVTRTAEALPRLVLAAALCYGGLYLARRMSTLWHRMAGVFLLLLGLGSVGLGLAAGMEYEMLAGSVQPEALATLRSSAGKTLTLCAIYFLILTPIGALGLRTPESRR